MPNQKVIVDDYDGIHSDELNTEYAERFANFEAAIDKCSTIQKRKLVMALFIEKMKDLALKAELEEDYDLRTKCRRITRQLRKRCWKGSSY